MEPDPCDSHDPYTEDSVYPEPGFCTVDIIDLYGYRGVDHYSLYRFRHDVGIRSIAAELFCILNSLHPALYDAGNQLKKSVCASLWRAAMRKGGLKNELGKNLDEFIRNNKPVGA